MRGANCWVAQFLFLACLFATGCAHTRDVSTTAEYKPWIGKTVQAVGGGYNIFSPAWGPYFMDYVDGYNGYPIVAKVPEGYPVVIEAVKRTEGRHLMGNTTFAHDQLILSMEHPREKNKRIRVWSEINYVEPFKDKEGYTVWLCGLPLPSPRANQSPPPDGGPAMKIKDFDRLPTIHYTQMPEPDPNSATYRAQMTFRRELPRLLAEGHEGKWALIKGNEIIGVYDDFDDGYQVGLDRYFRQGFILQPVREWQPVLRG
jgi:hypothetical protein